MAPSADTRREDLSMPRVAHSEAVVPKEMSEAERGALADALLEVYGEIFKGATREYIVKGMVETKSDFTTILLHKSEEGKIVGYFAIHFFERRFRGVLTTVVRSSVGMLRAYRGQNANIGWALGVLLKRRLARPGMPFYGMGSFVHPSSYLQVARYVDVFWPTPDAPVPPDMLEFIAELADEFGMPRIDPAQPLVRAGSMPTKETDAEREYWRQCDKPAARFFVSMNPTYGQGSGLVTMFPITASMLASLGARIARDKAKLVAEGALVTAQRLPLGGRLLRPAEVRKHLRATPLFGMLDEASLEKLVALADVVTLKAGKTLFRAGDEGDDLYVVARGAVSVLDGDEQEMIDQLGSGALFGEIAVLAGGRRTATVRTAIPTTFVRIPGDALRAAMKQNEKLGAVVWGAFTARIFDSHLRATGRHTDVARSARLARVQGAPHADVEPGTSIPTTGDAFLMVLRGSVLIEQGATQLSAQAPIVIEADPSARVTVKSAARVVHVPPFERPASPAN
jgi:CRP-like cAMP-binding protein